MQVKVEGTNYVKDMGNQALLNTNKSDILENEARKKIRQNLLTKNEEINTLKEQVSSINDDLSEIKNLLKILLEKKLLPKC